MNDYLSWTGGSQLGHFWPSGYTYKYFEDFLFRDVDTVTVHPSSTWTEGSWWLHERKDERPVYKNNGRKIVNHGSISGISFGGNISTLCLLLGTEYITVPKDAILFLEECGEYSEGTILRHITHLHASGVLANAQGVIFGRFQNESKVRDDFLIEVMKEYIGNKPCIMNMDFGHTEPMFTFPIGGRCKIDTFHNELSFFLTS